MDAAVLLLKRLGQRTHWVDLPDGKRVQVRRPPEVEFAQYVDGVSREHVSRCVVGWSGFTEADLLGPSAGSSDPAEFSPELWADVVADRVDYVRIVADGLAKTITDHLERKKAIEGN